eukprot:gnl/TRDRNA2_/TRDRNA2_136277_c1_seq1.p1 gnl/TRDRNA2_/TRDRNA2_136277_c1~~gnl/TRDRNA2_/TRDRNA2_136277_c1_seq1.p1  ORF type:complete len:400 (+),score=19.51 gnl/TRDRNA2_/TRDRNA2_136277_c1_seq1:51-1250(+)
MMSVCIWHLFILCAWGVVKCLRLRAEEPHIPDYDAHAEYHNSSEYKEFLNTPEYRRFMDISYDNLLEEILHGSLSFDRKLAATAGPLNTHMKNWPAINKRQTDPKIVISLTTVPEMFKGGKVTMLSKTLNSLLNQTVAADAIELNLPSYSARLGKYGKPERDLPKGINVYYTEDWLTLTNIIPTVQRAKMNISAERGAVTKRPIAWKESQSHETLVIVVDDDKVYPPSLVEDHLRAFREKPSSVSACRGFKLPPARKLSGDWDGLQYSHYGHKVESPVQVAIVTGSDSWSSPASLFNESLWTDLKHTGSAMRLMNDIWVSGQLSKHNVPKYVIPCRQECWSTWVHKQYGAASGDTGRSRTWLNNEVITYFKNAWSPAEVEIKRTVQSFLHGKPDFTTTS